MVGHHPYDENGRFVPRDCPVCGDGKLQYTARLTWECDGLCDPNDTQKELQTCAFDHIDGQQYLPRRL